jgi:hypothetical protein
VILLHTDRTTAGCWVSVGVANIAGSARRPSDDALPVVVTTISTVCITFTTAARSAPSAAPSGRSRTWQARLVRRRGSRRRGAGRSAIRRAIPSSGRTVGPSGSRTRGRWRR